MGKKLSKSDSYKPPVAPDPPGAPIDALPKRCRVAKRCRVQCLRGTLLEGEEVFEHDFRKGKGEEVISNFLASGALESFEEDESK